MRNINIDLSDKIKSHDLFCDCEDGSEELISEESWAAEKNKGKKLNKPFRTPGGPKKFSVYVKNEKGNVVKVNFGDPNMSIKRDNPERRKSFRARHNCDNPGPKTKARYWSCRQWRAGTKVQGSEEDQEKQILEILDESNSSRPGAKSAAQTPSKPDERKKGSSKNPPGSAGTKPTAKKDAEKNLKKKDEKSMVSSAAITFSEKVTKALKTKVANHNKKHPSKKVTLGQLKKVYRRGAGAFSTSHRPGMTRGGWAMARVNMYLKMRRGGKVKDSYRKADSDVAKANHTYLEDDGDFGIGMEEEIQVNIDLKKYDLLEEKENDLDDIFKDDIEAGHNMSKYSFNNPGEAMKMAKKMGLSGIHTHGEGDNAVFMPGKNHKDLMKKLDHSDESDAGHKPNHKKGLWENIRDKKRRMGKNYRPAKPGDKDRPSKEALERAKGGLTEKQKKLPPAIQKAILRKMCKKPKEESKEKKDKEK